MPTHPLIRYALEEAHLFLLVRGYICRTRSQLVLLLLDNKSTLMTLGSGGGVWWGEAPGLWFSHREIAPVGERDKAARDNRRISKSGRRPFVKVLPATHIHS